MNKTVDVKKLVESYKSKQEANDGHSNVEVQKKIKAEIKVTGRTKEETGILQSKLMYATPGAAGLDLCVLDETNVVNYTCTLVDTGIAVSIPVGFVGIVVPRSSMGKPEHRVSLANTLGIIDSDYRGNILLRLETRRNIPVTFKQYERVAQLLVVPVFQLDCEFVDQFSSVTERGAGGFGSSGR